MSLLESIGLGCKGLHSLGCRGGCGLENVDIESLLKYVLVVDFPMGDKVYSSLLTNPTQ